MTSVVYYIRRDGLIKIGTTGNFIQRMHKLRPDEVLAVEPGGRRLETHRHRQFAEHHVPDHPSGTEWFRPAAALLAHADATAAQHGVLPLPRRRAQALALAPDVLAERYLLAKVLANAKSHLAEVLSEINEQGDNFAKIGDRLGIHEATAARWAKPPAPDKRRKPRMES